AGRIVYQDITLIDKEIAEGKFFANPRLTAAISALKARGGALHILGLVSDGCVHSSLRHLHATLRQAAMSKLPNVFVHAFTDGRDTAPTSGAGYLTEILGYFSELNVGRLATVMGRYWAMDRDRRWERTQLAYDAMVKRQGEECDDPIAAVKKRYTAGETDEFLKPLIVCQPASVDARIKRGDLVLCLNFRADRMRQICYYLTGATLKGAPAPAALGVDLLTMTNYDSELSAATVLYPPRSLNNILGAVIADHGLRQLRIAETEKYPHVTFFFSGGREAPFTNEDRELIPSPKVATYDLQPEMSLPQVTETLVEKIRSQTYDLIILNYANCDMVGHTGSLKAAIKAVEAVDHALGEALAALDEVGGDALITADHGNAEQMYDPATNGPHTAHTTNLVPLIFYGPNKNRFNNPRRGGVLADIAPTILELLGIPKPAEMTGESFASGTRTSAPQRV
ncbi:MAG TPA: 2,3-bisphosphoglycerate-independent phosphoglycerate mutase, partial [candidate division Zixibacteria bacterium]|nr:2,3-bisphosphoglycerate-independent phosphoglycerate mutase [candidate division Zixibacteria bacterium]